MKSKPESHALYATAPLFGSPIRRKKMKGKKNFISLTSKTARLQEEKNSNL